ncbi:MAG: metallophosphoesterase family protein, partial [Candidatus Omnitrophica bacterium]|nr:metallophosphoesterase family protein [Candidatus Omnitrophota bacterium]
TVGNFKIGLIHELGQRASKRVETARQEFRGIKLDAVIFGHTHCPLNETNKGILFFNPGSPTDNILSPYKSIGIINVSDKITGKIIKLRS